LPGAGRRDEIGQLARAFAETKQQLTDERHLREKAESFALLGRMATSLAHEIHNPLSAIRLHTQLLDTTPATQLAAAARETLPILLEETRRIEGLVNEWMFLARPSPPQRSSTDLGRLVPEVLVAHRAAAAHARVEMRASVPASTVAVVDARRISQVIRNVVLNSFQAMPDGGVLFIAADLPPCRSSVRLTFQDTGPGFSAVALQHHHELFYSEREGGMGIGLTVCSEILRAHGGALEVANATDGGALVTLVLPAS
jgi:signal transduction histidine kinase